MSNIVTYIRQDGLAYCVGPEAEMQTFPDAELCPVKPEPLSDYVWNDITKSWDYVAVPQADGMILVFDRDPVASDVCVTGQLWKNSITSNIFMQVADNPRVWQQMNFV